MTLVSGKESKSVSGAGLVTDLDGRQVVVFGPLNSDGSAATVALGSSPAGAPSTQTSVAVDSTGVDVLATNASATYRLVENVGAVDVTIKLGTGTVTDNSGIVVKANGGAWDGKIGDRFYTGALRGKCVAGSSTLSVVEG